MEDNKLDKVKPTASRAWRIMKRLARSQQVEESLEELGLGSDMVVMERSELYARWRRNPLEMLEWLESGKEVDDEFVLESILRELLKIRGLLAP